MKSGLPRVIKAEDGRPNGGRDRGSESDILRREVDDQRPSDRTARAATVVRHALKGAVEAIALKRRALPKRLVERGLIHGPWTDPTAAALPFADHPFGDTEVFGELAYRHPPSMTE